MKIWEKGIKPKGMFTISALNEMCKIDDDESEENIAKMYLNFL
jgi:hypothetical protein